MKYLSSKEMSKVDKFAVKSGLEILQMMENAGRELANFTIKLKPKKIFIFCGKGNNGGGGLAAARHLSTRGFKVIIILAEPSLNKDVKKQLKTLLNEKIIPVKKYSPQKGDIIIDALLGYNISGDPRGNYSKLIKKINIFKERGLKVISLDIPSGTDPNALKVFSPEVKPSYILTLAMPKKSLIGRKNVYLANIGIPQGIYKKLKIPFDKKSFLLNSVNKLS